MPPFHFKFRSFMPLTRFFSLLYCPEILNPLGISLLNSDNLPIKRNEYWSCIGCEGNSTVLALHVVPMSFTEWFRAYIFSRQTK
jgi:hypothetical protein